MNPLFESPFPQWIGYGSATTGQPDRAELLPDEMALPPSPALPARREMFALGRLAARRAIENLGVPPAPIPRQPDGSPRWPDGLVGSITHVGEYAIAAVAPASRTYGLGLDLEDERRVATHSIARVVADRAEQGWIAGDRGRLISLFSAKEALYKAFYPRHGSFFDFDAVHLDPAPHGFVATLQIALADWAAGSRCHVRSDRQGHFVQSSVLLLHPSVDSPPPQE